MAQVIMIDRDPSCWTDMVDHLACTGHLMRVFADQVTACRIITDDRPAVVVVGRPSGNVFRHELCRHLREIAPAGPTLIIVLLPGSTPLTRVKCLEEGADDVMELPLAPEQLLLRVRTLMAKAREASSILAYGGIVMQLDEFKVKAAGTPVRLPASGFQLLRTFLEHPEQILSRADLLAAFDGARLRHARSIDSHVRRLRSAMAPMGLANLIVTISSVGYMLSTR